MNFSKNAHILRWILIAVSFFIVIAILWNTYDFSQKFKIEERKKMEILVESQKSLYRDLSSDKEFRIFKNAINEINEIDTSTKQKITSKYKTKFEDFSLESSNDLLYMLISKGNTNIPIITTDVNGFIKDVINFDLDKEKDSVFLYKQLTYMKTQNKPITLSYNILGAKDTKLFYYKNSNLLTKLKYYPLGLLLILFLFAAVIFLVFKSTRVAEQNKLWAGMAKETAHQIGTPLSSLLGWVEILRMDNVAEDTVIEIEKDVHRLNTIADRFSKIGSIPKLEKVNIVTETRKTFDYLKSRFSNQIVFTFNTDNDIVFANANKQLFSWVIENVIKNAIDAMQGKGKLTVEIKSINSNILILVTDSGKGIAKNQFKKIFETGFTTKKRGWGLGLSLAKRIIADYHNGRIYVKNATLNKGTCIAISLKKMLLSDEK